MQRVSKLSHLFLFAAVLVAVTVFSVGCASSSSSSSGTKIRFVNASVSSTITTVNVLIDGATVATALANGGAATAYLPLASGTRHIQIQDPATSTNLVDVTPTLAGGSNTTVILKDFITTTNTPLILTDDNSAPTSGSFKVRAINLAPNLNAGSDVYVVPSTTTTLTGVTPTFSALPFPPTTASYVTDTAGSWEVLFTQSGSQGILAGGTPTTFAAGQVETELIVEDASGTFSEVSLVDVQ